MKQTKVIEITEDLLKNHEAGCGEAVDYVLIPENLEKEFFASDVYRALQPMLYQEGQMLIVRKWVPPIPKNEADDKRMALSMCLNIPFTDLQKLPDTAVNKLCEYAAKRI